MFHCLFLLQSVPDSLSDPFVLNRAAVPVQTALFVERLIVINRDQLDHVDFLIFKGLFQFIQQLFPDSLLFSLRYHEYLRYKEEILFRVGIDISQQPADDCLIFNCCKAKRLVITQDRADSSFRFFFCPVLIPGLFGLRF